MKYVTGETKKKIKKCPVMMLVNITASNNNNLSIKYRFSSKEMSSVLYVDVEVKSKPATLCSPKF